MVTGRHREDRVAVERRVYRHDCSGVTVVGHLRHFRSLRFGEDGIGCDDTDSRILAGLSVGHFTSSKQYPSVSEFQAIFGSHACDHSARCRINNVAHGIDRD